MAKVQISIHAPREGSDKKAARVFTGIVKFLSTLPARGATLTQEIDTYEDLFLSTLPARGATQPIEYNSLAVEFLSTLPARGATFNPLDGKGVKNEFLSTLPARGATPPAPRRIWGWP